MVRLKCAELLKSHLKVFFGLPLFMTFFNILEVSEYDEAKIIELVLLKQRDGKILRIIENTFPYVSNIVEGFLKYKKCEMSLEERRIRLKIYTENNAPLCI